MRRNWSIAPVVLTVLLSWAGTVAAQVCASNCNQDSAVTRDEILHCLSIALGLMASDCTACDPDADGLVRVDELVQGVDAAVTGCAALVATGTCLRPGPTGLVPCSQGTTVQASRCDDRSTCLSDPSAMTQLNATTVDENGEFSVRLDANMVGTMPVVFDAAVDPASGTDYQIVDFGAVGAGGSATLSNRGGAGSGGALTNLLIDPSSEAAVRLLNQNGLQNFSNSGARDVIAAVRLANRANDFAGETAAGAATEATDDAAQDQTVQAIIVRARMITVDVSADANVAASSTFSPNFPAVLAIDGDRRTSWFSNGSLGGPLETFAWSGRHQDVLVSIAILSNAQHANPDFHGFGFGSVRIQVFNATGAVVFDVSRDLPGDLDPDVVVFPEVAGQSILLTFRDHDNPSCGGFSELKVVARRPSP